MKTSCSCHHNLDLCFRCTSHTCYRPAQNLTRNNQMEQITKKYAILMENQLKKLSEAKEEEIDELNQTISQLRMTITKLQIRSGLDKNSEKQLREKVVHQAEQIQALENEIMELKNAQMNRKAVVKEVVKQVVIKVPVELGLSKQDIDGLYAQNAQLKASLQQKQIIYLEKGAQILRQLSDHKKQISDLNENLTNLQQLLSVRNNEIERLHTDNKQLEERIQILVKPHTRKIEPVIINKIQHPLPQIETVYIDRPVLQTKFVEVEKIVNHFLQPERPIINRIIQCQRQQPNYAKQHKIQQLTLQQQISYDQLAKKYEDVIFSYQSQRQNLAKQIRERDHDYHLLTKQVQLCQKINDGNRNRGNGRTNVDVDVKIIKNEAGDISESDSKNMSKAGKKTSNIHTGKPVRNKGGR